MVKASRYQYVITEEAADQSESTQAAGPVTKSYPQTMFGERTAIRDSAVQQLLAYLQNTETQLSEGLLANIAPLTSTTPEPSYTSARLGG